MGTGLRHFGSNTIQLAQVSLHLLCLGFPSKSLFVDWLLVFVLSQKVNVYQTNIINY